VEPIRFEVGRLVLTSPMTAGTNLLLAIQCAFCWARLRRASTPRARLWGCFFFFLGAATLAGVPKHALAAYDDTYAYGAVLLAVNACTGIASLFAQLAALSTQRPSCCTRRAQLLVRTKLAVLLGLLSTPRAFLSVLLDSVLSLAFALALELRAWRRGRAGSGRTAVGVVLGALPGLVYVLRVPNEPWFGPIDLAHVLMMGSLAVIYSGAAAGGAREAAGPGCRR
jgi:hypothetical protein